MSSDDDKPDTGDLVNQRIVDDVADVMSMLEEAYTDLDAIPGWYNLVKQQDKRAARVLIKFLFLMREEWLQYGRGRYKAGVFGVVNEPPKYGPDISNLPY